MSRHFVIVRTCDAAVADRQRGFSVHGFETAAYRFEPGDKLAVYVGKPLSGFVATLEVVGSRFVSEERIWTVRDNPTKLFPYRYPTSPLSIAPEGTAVRFTDSHRLLGFFANLRNRRLWGMLFIRSIRNLTAGDFSLIDARVRGLNEIDM